MTDTDRSLKGSAAVKRIISILLVLMLLLPACALAELRRGDSGEEVRALQQMLWETGFIFEEPDGVFGKNTETAVKWFQEYALLEQTGVVDDRTLDSLYACWLQIMDESDGYASGDDTDQQTPGYGIEGDYPAYCHRYTTNEGDEHIELCGRHAQLDEDTTLPALEKWTNELNALYDEWLELYLEEDRAAIATSRTFFTLWLEQQAAALKQQGAADVDERIVTLLRNQCVDLCERTFDLTIE